MRRFFSKSKVKFQCLTLKLLLILEELNCFEVGRIYSGVVECGDIVRNFISVGSLLRIIDTDSTKGG